MAALKDPRATLPLDKSQFQHWLAQHPQHRLPLFIVAYGRHLLDQPQAIQLSGMEIIRELSDREISRLRKAEHGVKIAEDGLLMLKAIACLHGGLSETDVRLLATHSTEALRLPNCKTLAKTPEWQEEKGLPAIEPDLLAAQFFHSVLSKEQGDQGRWLMHGLCIREDGIADALSRLARLRFDYRFTLLPRPTKDDGLISALIEHVSRDGEACKRLEASLNKDNLV